MNFDRYKRPIALSDPGRHAALFDGLPRDTGALAETVQGPLIHQHLAPAYGVTLSRDQRAQSHVRAVEKILGTLIVGAGCSVMLAPNSFPQVRPSAPVQQLAIEVVGLRPLQRSLADGNGAATECVARQHLGDEIKVVALAVSDRIRDHEFGIAIHFSGIDVGHAELDATA
jgi:hypothetical protein